VPTLYIIAEPNGSGKTTLIFYITISLEKTMDEEYYKKAFKMLRLGNRGVYAIEGKPVFVMPNGEIRTERP